VEVGIGGRRNSFAWEEDQVSQLMSLLDNKKLATEGESIVDK